MPAATTTPGNTDRSTPTLSGPPVSNTGNVKAYLLAQNKPIIMALKPTDCNNTYV